MASSQATLLLVLSLSGALTGTLAAAGWRYRTEIGADWFAATMTFNTLWIALTIGQVLTPGTTVSVAIELVLTMVSISVPPLWFAFVLAYTGREQLLTGRRLAALWAVPAVEFALIPTAPLHRLYYASFEVRTVAGRSVVEATPGPAAYVVLGYIYVLFALGLWFVARTIWEYDRLYAGQAFWLLVGTVAPVLASLPAALGVDLLPVSPIPIAFVVTGLAYGYALFRHRLLDVVPAARRIGERAVVEDLAEGIVIVDDGGTVLQVNDSAERILGRDSESLVGDPVDAVLPVTEGVALADLPAEFRRDGRSYEVTASAVRDFRDERVGQTLVVRDITERRGRKQRLSVLNRVLRHNLRNNLTGVLGRIETLADRLDGDDRDLAETAAALSADLVSLAETARDVEELMDRPLDPASVSVSDLVEGVLEEVLRERSATVEVSVPDDLTVVTDAVTLRFVLEHVVRNAIDHADRPDPTVEISVDAHSAGVVLHVDDDGPGIPPEEVAVLEADAETALEHGTGLGLWVILWGSRRLGGDVTFANTDSGARVSLWVPARDARIDPPSPLPDGIAADV